MALMVEGSEGFGWRLNGEMAFCQPTKFFPAAIENCLHLHHRPHVRMTFSLLKRPCNVPPMSTIVPISYFKLAMWGPIVVSEGRMSRCTLGLNRRGENIPENFCGQPGIDSCLD